MMPAITILLVIACLVTAPAVILFALEIMASAAPKPRPAPTDWPAFTVLVPAHDEAGVIAATLQSIVAQLRPQDHLLVIADNCTDDTAAIAAAQGAEVTRRDEAERRGKGYALAHGVAHAARWDTPVTIVVDADCHVADGALAWLTAEAARTGRPIQGDYVLTAPADGSFAMRFSAFAIRVKNRARLIGCTRLGLPCVLTGSGMAFPHAALDLINLGSAEIVEDLLSSIELAAAGLPARFCAQAQITSPLPQDSHAAEVQRARWEQGYLSIMRRFVTRLLLDGIRFRDPARLLMGLDVAIPPLSLLGMTLVAMLCGGALWAIVGGGVVPLMLCAIQVVLFVLAIGLAWHRHGRDLIRPVEFATLPLSLARKMGFYLRLARNPQHGWVRTARDEAKDAAND